MALRLQRRSWENQDGSVTHVWRLIIEDYSSGERVARYPAKKNYRRYGLDPDDTYERARAKLTAIQAKNKVTRQAEKRAAIEHRLRKEDLAEGAFLPQVIFADFLNWLTKRRLWDRIPDKTLCHIRCMRKLILDVNTCPSKWPDEPAVIYLWFRNKKLSLSTIEKILPLLNAYGYFYCREMSLPFLPVPRPIGDVARRIEDANLNERDGRRDASKPLAPPMLSKLDPIPEDQLRWMRVSMYFGLRPSEIDELKAVNEEKIWKIKKDPRGTSILWFYQRKLVRVERARRWKRIPAILPEQVELLKEIAKHRPMKRPHVKFIRSRLGEGFGTYAGRKGFEAMMRGHGQDNRNISRWLGHQDVNRTESNYREVEAVEYSPI